MYWSVSGDVMGHKIAPANLDGSEIEYVVFVDGVRGIAIGPIPEPATLGLVVPGGLALLRRRRK